MKKEIELQTENILCPHCKSSKTEKQGVSNWHDNSGIYYMVCTSCNKEWNERWYNENYEGEKG